jgi:hypothetical protein
VQRVDRDDDRVPLPRTRGFHEQQWLLQLADQMPVVVGQQVARNAAPRRLPDDQVCPVAACFVDDRCARIAGPDDAQNHGRLRSLAGAGNATQLQLPQSDHACTAGLVCFRVVGGMEQLDLGAAFLRQQQGLVHAGLVSSAGYGYRNEDSADILHGAS